MVDQHRLPGGAPDTVQVTSSNFPRWDRNLNTGEPEESATTARVARQQVFHDPARPSRIVLPVVPAQ
ncbi:hypothetical protein [Streptomyces hokutonensis]|uniref:hypothetical protein n=1 Tax=Streptomyces hokutonensis TaxID=1306990 RepID=UPI0036A64BE2